MEVKFEFGTKAETLKKLQLLLKDATILPQVSFSVEDWNRNSEEIINRMQSFFNSEKLIIRSSAMNEDSEESSMAGNYESVLNVIREDDSRLRDAIELVKESFLKHHEHDSKDQILIQPMLDKVEMSGVIFTRCNNTGGAYYIINYEESLKTDGVTSGSSLLLKTFSYFKSLERLPSNQNLANLIKISKEIEKITGIDFLDIEFAIKNGEIYILQVRPLVVQIDYSMDEKIKKTIDKIKEFIVANDKKFPNLHGYKAVFGVMPDWNPAEIIGESPKPLAFSLYKELITDHVWPLSRKEVGYKDVGYHPGIVSLGGKPYVDVRLSFNTFVPASLSETTSEKLVNFYIDKLTNNPHLHDKVEFKIAHTCYKFGYEKEEEELRNNNFSPLQIKEIKASLLDLTNKIVGDYYTSIDKEMDLINSLEYKREKIINSEINDDVKITQLIHDCKYYGTLPFSKLARFAFVGNILLSSLVDSRVISQEDREGFFGSINSVATEFVKKLGMLKRGELDREEFLKEFGHLRPGTYDLCSKTYAEGFDDYFNLENVGEEGEDVVFEFSADKKERIKQMINITGFDFSVDEFLDFTKRALVAREKGKLEFTKNLSLILDLCYNHMKEHGFTKEDVTFLEVNDIIHFSHKSKSINEIEELREKIRKNREDYEVMKILRLPPLVYMERNVEYFHQLDNQPNYITNKSITGEVIFLDEGVLPEDIEGKIVLIVNADPGYDWIFGHNIKGLITKYGGVASHMSIRCAEFGLPAAIGCGESIFEYVNRFKNIELNCASKQVKGVL